MNARESEHRRLEPAQVPAGFEPYAVAKISAGLLRSAHTLCDEHGDVASASLIENWIDEAELRTWFLYEATRLEAGMRGHVAEVRVLDYH